MGLDLAQHNKGWRPQLTRWEKRAGWVFFALYILVFPFVQYGIERLLNLDPEFSAVKSGLVYYAAILLLLIAVFWDFLRHAAAILRENFRASFFVLGIGLLAGTALTCLAGLIPMPVENPAILEYKLGHSINAKGVWLMLVVLRPAVEEILYRGLLFGSLRKRDRALAYGLSVGLFALLAVWKYAISLDMGPAYLLLAVQYLPLGAVLCWSYDVSGSVYTPVVLRIALQAAFYVFALAAPGEVPPMGL